MVSVSSGGSAGGSGYNYYTQAQEYYNQKGQTDGVWHGKGLEAVGLKDGQDVEKQAFDNLAKGYSIAGTEALVYNAGRENHRETYDITFSPDKSVSIAREFVPEMRETIDRSIEKAVLETMKYVESQAQYRETFSNETVRVDSGNLIFATFKHDVTRSGDPGVHVHSVVMNLTKTADGSMKAIEPLEIYKAQNLIQRDFTSNLANELLKSNVAIEITKNGFKIQGVSDAAAKAFSKRSKDIAEKYDKIREQYPNLTDAAVKEIAALATRQAKDLDRVKSESLYERWKVEEKALNIDIKSEIEKAQQHAKETGQAVKGGLNMNALTAAKAAVKDLSNKESVLDKKEIVSKALEYCLGSAVKIDIEKAIDNMQKSGEIIQKNNSFASKETIDMQKSVEFSMKAGVGGVESISKNREQIDNAIKNYESGHPDIKFSKEQITATRNILESNDRYQSLQGAAGAGKTSMLDVINTVAKAGGYNVVAISFQGKAADEMAKNIGAKNESMTIESFKNYIVKPNDVVINDEASMTSLRDMKSIVDKVRDAAARLVNIGDIHQIQAIKAGKIFEESHKFGMTVSQLKESMRQKDDNYRQVVKDFNDYKINNAFDKMEKVGKIFEVKESTFLQETVKKYNEMSKIGDTKIITNLNKDRISLNKTIQAQKIESGDVKDVHTFVVKENKNLSETQMRYSKNYEIGDVVFLKETAAGLGKKGAEFKVTEIDKVNNVLKLENSQVTNFHFTKLDRSEYKMKDTTIFTDKIGKNKQETMTAHSQTITDINQAGGNLSIAGIKATHTYATIDLKDASLADKIGGVARETTRNIGVGDEIKLTKNDKKYDVKNGQFGVVKEIRDKDTITVQIGKGKSAVERTLKMSEYNHIDHAYAVTVNNFQGAKSDNIIAALKSKNATQNSTYTAITRGVSDYAIVTDNALSLRENSQKEQIKTTSADMLSKENIRDIQREQIRAAQRAVQQAARTATQVSRAEQVSQAASMSGR